MDKIVRRKRKKPVLTGIIAAFLALVVTALFINARLTKPLAALAEQRVRERVERAFVSAVAEALEPGEDFGLLTTQAMGEGSFVINADTLSLNRIMNLVTGRASELVSEMGSVGAGVELFQAAGFASLGGRGPNVTARFSPVGAVSASPVSRLTSAGINQCLYTLSLILTADLRVQIAGKTHSLTVKNTVPIAETVIVGNTPQVYTNVANEEDMLNLIPTDAVG